MARTLRRPLGPKAKPPSLPDSKCPSAQTGCPAYDTEASAWRPQRGLPPDPAQAHMCPKQWLVRLHTAHFRIP
jgi:hypothetical protein